MTIKMTMLDNGLRVATDTMEGVESVSLGLWVGVGTRHEEACVNGVAHLVEHMLFKGTKRRSAFDISAELENVGGHLNAYTTREVTAYHAKVLKQDVRLAADVLTDMLQNSTLIAEELERERGVIIQEIGQSVDQPDDIIFDHVQAVSYPNSGLGKPVLGTPDIIRGMKRENMVEYIGSHYAAPQIVFAAAGAIQHDAFVDMAQKMCDGFPRIVKTRNDTAVFTSGDVREARGIEQLHALLMFKGVSFRDPDYYAISVLSTLLGGGMSSRLFQEIREKRGLVYSIYSFASAYHDGGQFGIYAGTDPERIDELLPVVADEMIKVTKDVTMDELKRAKAQLRASLFMAQESTMARAERLAYNQLMHQRFIPAEETIAKIEAVSADDMKRLTRQILSLPPVSGFVGPLNKVPAGDAIARRFAA